MRARLSILPLVCAAIGAACGGDDAHTATLDAAASVPDVGLDASPLPAADGGVSSAPWGDGGAVEAGGGPLDGGESGSDATALPQGDTGTADGCPAKFTTASYMQMQMTWPGSIGFLAGQDFARAWAKTTFTRTAEGMTTESVLCGAVFPVVSTTFLLGEIQLANDFPASAFDQPTMPRAKGRATWRDGKLIVDVGANVLGATLSDPEGAWPYREALTPADHDGDGKPGITVMPRKDPPFGLPPADILMTKYLDAMYTASRMGFRLTGTSEGCDGPAQGDVEPLAFNYTVVGCHIVDGGDCGEDEVNLIENQSPTFTPADGGTWRSVPIAESASCAEVRSAIKAE